MAVRLAYASLSEYGGINGQKGDQTGSEVRVNNWYSDAWIKMFIHPDPNVRERHAIAAEAGANNPVIGYGQFDRNTLYQEATKVNMDFSLIKVAYGSVRLSTFIFTFLLYVFSILVLLLIHFSTKIRTCRP